MTFSLLVRVYGQATANSMASLSRVDAGTSNLSLDIRIAIPSAAER